jgi:predicted exporter
VFEEFVEDVIASKTMTPLTWDAFRASGLQLPLDELLHTTREGWLGIIQLAKVVQPDELSRRLGQWPATGVSFMDLKRETGALVDEFRSEALTRVGWAALAVVVMLAVTLRDPGRLLRVVGPVLIAVAVSAAMPLLSGVRLNLFHLVSLLLVAGIGLDYSLFFTRPGIGKGEFLATLHAVTVCAVSTSAVFALLTFSAIPVLHAIGVAITTGVVAALLLTWAFSLGPPD